MLKIFEPLDFQDAKPRRPRQLHVVRPGETLDAVASMHGMKEIEVRALNNFWQGNVTPGQKIFVHKQKRSQSLPVLPFGEEYAEKMERIKQLVRRHDNYDQKREAECANPEDDDVEMDDVVASTYPMKRGTLDVIFEQQPHSETLGPRGLSFKSSTTAPPSRMVMHRSLSERLPTTEEAESNVFGLPKLIDSASSEILSHPKFASRIVPKLEACLPMRCRGYDWKLLYNTAKHGSSLHALKRMIRGQKATLIFIETCAGDVFGGFAASEWTNALSYYGTGESFVFTCTPQFELFTWKRTNTMIMLCTDDSIAMGGGGGFAWHLNADLSSGTTAPSQTFLNTPLASESEFEIANVEVWGFVL